MKSNPKSAEKEVVSLERKFWDESTNPKFVQEIFADDGITVFEPVGVIEKAAAVEMSSQSKPWTQVKIEDVTTRQLTPDCVVVAYHGTARRRGEKKDYRSRICSTYIKREGRWQLGATVHQPWDATPAVGGGKPLAKKNKVRKPNGGG